MSTDSEYQVRVRELREQAENLSDNSVAKVECLEEAARLADTHNDTKLAYELRTEVIHAACFGGFPDKELVAFAWCLAQCDRDPISFPESNLLWQYKWIMGSLHGFPQVSRAKIEEMYADMTLRFERCGAALRPVLGLRWQTALDMGDEELAAELHAKWDQSPRGWPSDCRACEQADHIHWLLHSGDDRAALESARPLLDGELRCASIPTSTYGTVLKPLMRLGRAEEAMRYHRLGYGTASQNRRYILTVSRHLDFLSLSGNHTTALRLLERHFPWALETADLGDRFWFMVTARFLCGNAEAVGRKTVRIRLPEHLRAKAGPTWSADRDGRLKLSAIQEWLSADIADLGSRFDRRNGNTRYSQGAARYATRLTKAFHDLPLRPRRGRSAGEADSARAEPDGEADDET